MMAIPQLLVYYWHNLQVKLKGRECVNIFSICYSRKMVLMNC